MAKVGKTAGIVAGLAVGLVAGAFLAALNPVLPRSDTTVVADAPNAVNNSGIETDDTSPKLGLVPKIPATGIGTQVANAPQQTGHQESNVAVELDSKPPLAVNVEGLGAATTEAEDANLALDLSQKAPNNQTHTPGAPTDQSVAEARPTIASKPAEPVVLKKPEPRTQSPEISTPTVEDTPTELEIVDQSIPEVSDAPVTVVETGKIQTSLPNIQEPAERIPAVPTVEVEEKVAPVPVEEPAKTIAEEDKPNTSGTFKTVGSRIKTQGETGGTRLAGLGKSRIKTVGESISDTQTQETTVPEEQSALKRNAVSFESTGLPLVSIVVVDDGSVFERLDKLKETGLPLAIAIAVDQDGVSERSAAYRKAGLEVLALAPRNVKLSLSGGQTDAQVAELLDQFFEIAPEAIGLIDSPSANLQKDQRLSRSVIKHFAKTGHGLITYSGGLNSVPRQAEREGVSAGTVFRILDTSANSQSEISQNLNRTAREARSKGQVVIMVAPTEEMTTALLAWSANGNGKSVAFAPVSASLLKNAQ